MNQKSKNVIIGLAFITAAVLLIVQKQFGLLDISIWKLVFTFVFGVSLVKSIMKVKWTGILFSLAFLAILYADELHIEKLSPWPLLGAALLGSIGLKMIFHKGSHTHVYFNEESDYNESGNFKYVEENSMDDVYCCDCAFSTSVKYVNSSDLREAHIDNAFGKITVYFDNAQLHDGNAHMTLDNAFGEMDIYIPKEWNVDLKTDQVFGHVSCIGDCAHTGDNYLRLSADTAFGQIVIHYV